MNHPTQSEHMDRTTLAARAKDAGLAASRRREAAYDLFRFHVKPSGRLVDLAAILENPNWISPENVKLIDFLIGWIPVPLAPGTSVFQLHISQEPEQREGPIYLRVAPEIGTLEFMGCMHQDTVDWLAQDPIIVDFSWTIRIPGGPIPLREQEYFGKQSFKCGPI